MADEKRDDYAVLAAKEYLRHLPIGWADCECPSCAGDRKYYAGEVARLAVIIRKHAEQWAHDYSCGCM